jgi:hypothetical protein
MSVLVALGALASASQLLLYGKRILFYLADLHDQVKEAPQQYREYELQLNLQVNLLFNIAGAIEQNLVLQVPELLSQLDGTLVDVKALQKILHCPTYSFITCTGPRRYWSLITGIEQQRKAFVHLENLNRKNTRLLLCISTVSASQFSALNVNVGKLVEIIQKPVSEMDLTEENVSFPGRSLDPKMINCFC